MRDNGIVPMLTYLFIIVGLVLLWALFPVIMLVITIISFLAVVATLIASSK